jgi:hypothetical protein
MIEFVREPGRYLNFFPQIRKISKTSMNFSGYKTLIGRYEQRYLEK